MLSIPILNSGSGFFVIFGGINKFSTKKMKKISSYLLSASFILCISCAQETQAQTFIPAYQTRANTVSQANINAGLQEFAGLGVKTTGSAANTSAFVWLQNKYASFGYTASQISEDVFTYNGNSAKNLIITKTGTLYPNTFVIVCGHYDTLNGVGANDNGSGTNAILEIARILKDVPTEYSIKFIHFSGEEQGFLGSQHYVNNVVNATTPKMDIRVVFNLDQVGGIAGQANTSITCESDQNSVPSTNNAASAAKTQELMNCVSLYSTLTPTLSNAYASDYMPFQTNNEIITGFYEQNGNSNPAPHTANDILSNMDPVYLFNVTKAAVGATQHFAVASSSVLAAGESSVISSPFYIFPTPAKDTIYIKTPQNSKKFIVELYDASGKLVLVSENRKEIMVSQLQKGVYTAKITSEKYSSSQKVQLK